MFDDNSYYYSDSYYNNSVDFQIDRITPSKIATVGLNDTISGTLTPAAQQAEYRLEVDKETVVLLDNLVRTGGNVYWDLEDWHSGRRIINGNSVYDASASQILSAGSYRLVVYTDKEAVKNYGLRLLDLSSATSVDSAQIIEGRLKNSGEMQFYQVEAQAGERIFVDFQDLLKREWVYDPQGSHYNYSANIRIIDPYGRQLSTQSIRSTGAEIVATVSGKYTVLLDITDTYSIELPYRMAVFVHKLAEPRLIDLKPVPRSMDLQVRDVRITATDSKIIHSGGSLKASWRTVNHGEKATMGDFIERVLVKNSQTGAVVAQAVLPYRESEAGVLLPQQSVERSLILRLPNGTAGAGTFTLTVETDAANSQIETGTDEQNNQASVPFVSELALYADLQVKNLSISPDTAWQAGDKVSISWQTANTGMAAAHGRWLERVEVINRSTGQTIAVIDYQVDETLPSDATSTVRKVEFVWPSGMQGIGRFEIRVSVDAQAQISEYGTGGETDNIATVQMENGPDLTVRNLNVSTTDVYAGGQVVLRWQDVNQGKVAVPASFQDRVQVYTKNPDGSLGRQIINTSVVFAGEEGRPLAAGESRERTFTFALPDGAEGTGDFIISVSADNNAVGQSLIFEVNSAGDAERNNSAQINLHAKAVEYADLQVTALTLPDSISSGQRVRVTWAVHNLGKVAATGSWTDMLVLTRDAITGNSDDIILARIPHEGGLSVGEFYSAEAKVDIPLSLYGDYRLAVIADVDGRVREPDSRGNNIRLSAPVDIIPRYADVVVHDVKLPENIHAGDNISISWQVQNQGQVATDAHQWLDRIYLSRTPVLGSDAVLLGSRSHIGGLPLGGSYQANMDVRIPSETTMGNYFLIVQTDAFSTIVNETGRKDNNISTTAITIAAETWPDLVVKGIHAPRVWTMGDTVTLSYTVHNQGNKMINSVVYDSIRLINNQNKKQFIELPEQQQLRRLAVGESYTQTLDFVVPNGLNLGDWYLEINADWRGFVSESEEQNNTGRLNIQLAAPDLQVNRITTAGKWQGGETISIEWETANSGNTDAGSFTDSVYLSQDGSVDQTDLLIGHIQHGSLKAGESTVSRLEYTLPADLYGKWHLLVISDSTQKINENGQEQNNTKVTEIQIALDAYADLAVTDIRAPERVIDDPAYLTVEWTVQNMGLGEGRTAAWTDSVIYSANDVLGDSDDIVLGSKQHSGVLSVGERYTDSITYRFTPNFARKGRLFVQTDSGMQVWENGKERNNTDSRSLDIMPKPYADLVVDNLSVEGQAVSGQTLNVAWSISNKGIGITDKDTFSETIWLSEKADGSGQRWKLANSIHIGRLEAGSSYHASFNVVLPEGLSGEYYLHLAVGGVFEFGYTDNNQRSIGLPITLAPSPDLVVEYVNLPTEAEEGSLIDISWTVLNQGEATASGGWHDEVRLVSADGSQEPVMLGRYGYTQSLEAGKRYTRSESIRLPKRLSGQWRAEVVTNKANSLYEHGGLKNNNVAVSDGLLLVRLNPRPDLRVSDVQVPNSVVAGGRVGVKYTVSNMGSQAANRAWQDGVYLSLDGKLSADDRLLKRITNPSSLATGEQYTSVLEDIEIPIRYRGDVYLIVVADDAYDVDEYPNENNNIAIAKLHVEAVPFADLVTSDITAPEQAVHGAEVEVSYKVSNKGSAQTAAEDAGIDSWTDTLWLARDVRRPSAAKGDILLGKITHKGHLKVGEDYLGSIRARLPEGLLSGEYFFTVWSDSYDVILEDTLAVNVNPDDPTDSDNNNYKARPVRILGITPPDLTVSAIYAPKTAEAGKEYTFSYTVKNRADAFENATWEDKVWLADHADLNKAKHKWLLGGFVQKRGLGNQESYTVKHSVLLAPSVSGSYLIVEANAALSNLQEVSRENNRRFADSIVSNYPSDLRVTSVTAEPTDSGELTQISWTVENFGGDVWSGTKSWQDAVYISKDPEFIPERAILLGTLEHINANGLISGGRYTANAQMRVPVGYDGKYYLYVITDHLRDTIYDKGKPEKEFFSSDSQPDPIKHYTQSVFEHERNNNNIGRGTVNITYKEPDLYVEAITLSNPTPKSGETLTVTWTVVNQGTRETRTGVWFDGLYLSNDDALDASDYPLVDQGTELERGLRVRLSGYHQTNPDGTVRYLLPGERYTQSATFTLPENIGGRYRLIVKADTETPRDLDNFSYIKSSIRDGLPTISPQHYFNHVPEFKDEGNNIRSIALPVTYVAPPDLRVTQVSAPTRVIAGQQFEISYQVSNFGGGTPANQGGWVDKIYLSKDRFLDLEKDHYLGYTEHNGGLPQGSSYESSLKIQAPIDLDGFYYVFVVTDPADTSKGFGAVREFEHDRNNHAAAEQPLHIVLPEPADLKVTHASAPSAVAVGEEISIHYTVYNDSKNQAYGSWRDAVYLSSDNTWDKNDIFLGHVLHVGGLAAGASYAATLQSSQERKIVMPPLKEGNWRVIVRPDAHNEVYEGQIRYTENGLVMAEGEKNNFTASAASVRVTVPELTLGTRYETVLNSGDTRLYRLRVGAGETLRIALDSLVDKGANELYVRYGDVPTSQVYDAAYGTAVAAEQEVLIPTTQAGDYYVLVKSRQAQGETVGLRAETLPLSIRSVTPDQGGRGSDTHRWVTVDIVGARFDAGATVKLSRPGIYEIEPERWQVLDATRIRAVFDLRAAPYGLYDVIVTNTDGQTVTEPYRFLVERAIEPDVTIGIGGPRSIDPGNAADYSVSLQSLTNVDTPYVRFDVGASEMGHSEYLIGKMSLPYVVFGSNIGGKPNGKTTAVANTQNYDGTPFKNIRKDIPWAALDSSLNINGINLAPGYALDINAGGFVGATFNVQTYPGLKEWLEQDFEGLRSKLYAVRPDWKEQGLLDGGVQDLAKISPDLVTRFYSRDRLNEEELLSLPFQFNISGSATPLTRAEFVLDQTEHAKKLRAAILADKSAGEILQLLAADESQWVEGWLAALETAGLLRPENEAAPIRFSPEVVSLNATLATGILLSKAGEEYRTQADILSFFAKVQEWYGDTALHAGDKKAKVRDISHIEIREDDRGNYVESPVPKSPELAEFSRNATQKTHFLNFNVFAGGLSEMEYLRHIGMLDQKFKPLSPQALTLTQYLTQAAEQKGSTIIHVQGPTAAAGSNGQAYLPANIDLPFTLKFSNTTAQPAGEIRLVTKIDANLDAYSVRLKDLKIGDINIHLPGDKAVFQGDFDFTESKGFIVRVSAGIDAEQGIITWLLQAVDSETGQVISDGIRGLLPGKDASSNTPNTGYVAYTVAARENTVDDVEVTAQARLFINNTPPQESGIQTYRLDARAPKTAVAATEQTNADGSSLYHVQWQAQDTESGIKHVTVYVAKDGGDFRIWKKQIAGATGEALFTGEAGS